MASQLRYLQPQSLLELPLEIRLRIYEFVFTNSNIYVLLISTNSEHRYLHIHGSDVGILLACRQSYYEARSEWYIANLWTVGFPPTLGFFLRSTAAEGLRRIKHLTMQIHELPDLNTDLLPGLTMLVIDFSTDLPSFMTGSWHFFGHENLYSQFADEAIARVHSTFKVLITELHEKSRTFSIGLFAGTFGNGYGARADLDCLTRYELFVNLDTKAVELRTVDWSYGDVHVPYLQDELLASKSEGSETEHSPEHSPHLSSQRCKSPPGREGSLDTADKDERGSVRSSEEEESSSDDEATTRQREAAARHVDWEDVKRIIENLSQDQQSADGVGSEDEALENFLGSEAVRAEGDDRDEQIASDDESDDEEDAGERLSESSRAKAERDREIRDLVLGEPEPQPGQEQEHAPVPLSMSEEQSALPMMQDLQPPAQLHVAGDQHRRVEERVIYTTRWPELTPSSSDLASKSEVMSQSKEPHSLQSCSCPHHSSSFIPCCQL